MTIYEEICATFRDTLPRRLGLHKAIKELPHRLRNAFSEEIGAPNGSVDWLWHMHQRSIPYVYLAWLVADANGLEKWEPCPDDHDLSRDADGVLWFGLGMAIVLPERPYFVHITIYIEDIREELGKANDTQRARVNRTQIT